MLKNNLPLIGIVLLIVCLFPITSPFSFPSGSYITVPKGIGLFELGEKLEQDRVIRSPFWFRTFTILLGGERDMKAGEYLMSRPENAFTIAWRVLHGDYDIETMKVTIPEGYTVEEISTLFGSQFPNFNHEDFIAWSPEGYLFPDTYFVQLVATASSTIKLLNDNFLIKIAPYSASIESSGKSLEEIIIMASLLEAEAKTKVDREMISDILWKRLRLGMPLQVDSEMGTYEFRGLPDKPINNPGLISIEASLSPTPTPYLYFLTGSDGQMHYAKTFEDHKLNKSKYL